jgi:hypothetical protein
MSSLMKAVIIALKIIQLLFKFQNFVDIFLDYKAIKRIEIPSCESEPCVLRIGQLLPVKITFEAGLIT